MMPREAMIEKSKKDKKFDVREYNRCGNCGRTGSYMRDFGLCRHCFRELAHKGQIPGVRKASW